MGFIFSKQSWTYTISETTHLVLKTLWIYQTNLSLVKMFLLKKNISNPTCEECFLGTPLAKDGFSPKKITSLGPNAGLASRLWLRHWYLHHGSMYHGAQKSFAILNDFGLESLRRHPSRGHMGGFLKWWYQTTIDFPTKNDHFGVFWGYHPFKETPI